MNTRPSLFVRAARLMVSMHVHSMLQTSASLAERQSQEQIQKSAAWILTLSEMCCHGNRSHAGIPLRWQIQNSPPPKKTHKKTPTKEPKGMQWDEEGEAATVSRSKTGGDQVQLIRIQMSHFHLAGECDMNKTITSLFQSLSRRFPYRVFGWNKQYTWHSGDLNRRLTAVEV